MSHVLRMERGGTGVSEALCQQSKHRSSLRETVTEYIRKYLQNHYLPRNAVGLINPLEPEGKKNYKVMSFSGKRFRMQYHMMIQHLLKKKKRN